MGKENCIYNKEEALKHLIELVINKNKGKEFWPLYQLAITNPNKLNTWTNNKLMKNPTADLWDIATKFFGNIWKQKKVRMLEAQTPNNSRMEDSDSKHSSKSDQTMDSNSSQASTVSQLSINECKKMKKFIKKNFSRSITTQKSNIHRCRHQYKTVSTLKLGSTVTMGIGQNFQEVQKELAKEKRSSSF